MLTVCLKATVLLGSGLSGAIFVFGEGGYECSGSKLMTAVLLSKVEDGGMMESI
jgi:hypothetical protein